LHVDGRRDDAAFIKQRSPWHAAHAAQATHENLDVTGLS
jgi:hypothetical protein